MPDHASSNLKKVKQLFDICEPLDQAQRERIFADASLERRLVEQVQRLLSIADDEQQNDQQANIIGRQLQGLSQSLEQDQRLGAYRVEREIGRGGMGIVFLAHRDDGSYRQQVAIKIAPSFASEEELKHFHRERQVLAQLQHSNIAMLLDGGATAEQRPYLVMEHIQGSAITDYCEKHHLNLQARLRLFLAVCDAVSFAHSRLIIHRDIKPENVLVTADGQVKLLDFGISKILHSQQKNGHTTLMVGLTPAYASPEQLKGGATTTATDVYGLGALLYKLLSGTSPHPGDDPSAEQMIRAICEAEPMAVSKAAAAAGTQIKSQSLKGDIDNITAKMLRKEPEHRYTSVSEVKKDLERFLRGEPVLATPPGLLYRSGKFVRRYPAASLLALSVFLAISGGLAASTHLANKLRRERDNLLIAQSETKRQASTAQRVTRMLTDMFDAASPAQAQGHTVDVDELLNSAVTKTRASLNDEPTVKTQLLRTLAQVKFNTGKYTDAVALQREAMDIGKGSSDPITRAADLSILGNYLREAGEREAAESSLTRATALLQQHPDAQLLAETQLRQGLLMRQIGKPKKAIEFFNAAQKHWEQKQNRGGGQGIDTRHNLATAYYDTADFSSATRLEERVLQEMIAFYGENHPKTLSSFQFLGQCYMRINRWDEAKKYLQRAYRIGLKIFSKDNVYFRTTARQYANLLRRLGYYQRGIDILTDLLSVDAQSKETTAYILNNRGYAYFKQGMMMESRRDLKRASEIFAQLLPDSSSTSFLTRSNFGEIMALSGDLDAGLALIEKIRRLDAKQYGEDDYGVADGYFRFARIALHERQLEKAQRYVEIAREIDGKHYARNHPVQLDIDEIEAEIAVARGDLELAKKDYEQLIMRTLEVFPEDAPLLAKQRSALGEVLWKLGQHKVGARLITDSQKKLLSQLPPSSIYTRQLKARAALVRS